METKPSLRAERSNQGATCTALRFLDRHVARARRKTGVLTDTLRLLAMTIPSKRVVLQAQLPARRASGMGAGAPRQRPGRGAVANGRRPRPASRVPSRG